MSQPRTHECTNCGELLTLEARNYRYVESGLTNVILQGAQAAECPRCGNEDLMLPRLIAIHEAIASALVKSPARLTGPQWTFLRKHLELSDEELDNYLHTGKSEVSACGPSYELRIDLATMQAAFVSLTPGGVNAAD